MPAFASATRLLAAAAMATLVIALSPVAAHAAGPARASRATADPPPASHTLHVGADTRTYLLQPVEDDDRHGRSPHPVLILLHGGTQSGAAAWRQTHLAAIARREGVILVAPDGLGHHWNDGRGTTIAGDGASTADDVGFLRALIAEVVAHDHGDPGAVFLFGVSNGGFMTMRFACEAGDLLRAAATGLATLPEAQAAHCPSTRPLPFLVEHGTEDPIVPLAGQPAGRGRFGSPQPAMRSSDDTFAFWADRARCAPTATRTPLTRADADPRGRWAERIVREGCAGGASVEHLVMHGSGHVFPGLAVQSRLVERVLGPDASEFDGAEHLWAFFAATLPHRAPGPTPP